MKLWFLSLGVISAIVLSVSALAFTGLPYTSLETFLQVNPYGPPGVSAAAQGDLNPTQIPNASPDDSVVNGDFLIQLITGSGSTLGDGVDEATTWVFDFTSHPGWDSFPTSANLTSAQLTLTVTPKASAVSQDIVKIEGLADINSPEIQSLSTDDTSTVEIDLLDFYSSTEILNAMTSDVEGQIPMYFADDAIISFAELRLVSDTSSN